MTDINDITITYEEDGVELVKEVDKIILARGTWPTILFKYLQWDPKKETYSEEKYTLRRYRKIGDEYRQQSKFNISNRQIIEALRKWL